MSKWITRSGYVFSIVGLALLTPISEFLPMDLWHASSSDSAYLKIVPVARTYAPEIVLIGIGLVLIVVGKMVSRRFGTHT